MKILLVEDNEMNRDMLSRRLARKGYEVVIAEDGGKGVELAATAAPDLVLMDMSLPVLDGWEANGLDSDGNGTFDVALPGASPVHKDLSVEMDYMVAEAVCPCLLPLAAHLMRIVAASAASP